MVHVILRSSTDTCTASIAGRIGDGVTIAGPAEFDASAVTIGGNVYSTGVVMVQSSNADVIELMGMSWGHQLALPYAVTAFLVVGVYLTTIFRPTR